MPVQSQKEIGGRSTFAHEAILSPGRGDSAWQMAGSSRREPRLAGGMNGNSWDNAALIIFHARSQAEAGRVAAADPAVKAYVFQAQVRPFDIHFLTYKYGPAPSFGSQPPK